MQMSLKPFVMAAGMAVAVCVASADAANVVTGEDKTIASPGATTNVTIEFYLDRTGGDDGTGLEVGNFNIRIELTGPDNLVAITGVGETTDHPQAFTLDTTTVTPTTEAFAGTFNVSSPFTIDDLDGLAEITLEVQPGALGVYDLSVVTTTGDDTQFTDPDDFKTELPFTVSHGSLTITAIPAPATMAMVAMVGAGAWTRRRRR